jgi:hypothetical protein
MARRQRRVLNGKWQTPVQSGVGESKWAIMLPDDDGGLRTSAGLGRAPDGTSCFFAFFAGRATVALLASGALMEAASLASSVVSSALRLASLVLTALALASVDFPSPSDAAHVLHMHGPGKASGSGSFAADDATAMAASTVWRPSAGRLS